MFKDCLEDISYITFQELLDYIPEGSNGFINEALTVYCSGYAEGKDKALFIEDRGILMLINKSSEGFSPIFDVDLFVLGSNCNLECAGCDNLFFKKVNLISDYSKISSFPIVKEVIYDPIFTKDIGQNIMTTLLQRFLTHSTYLYRNPFDKDSKKIIYFSGGSETVDSFSYSYEELYNKVINSKYGVLNIQGESGFYYICENKLIKACPDRLYYFGDNYCLTKYYICSPTETGGIAYLPTAAEELPIILNTIDVFVCDNTLKEKSSVAYQSGDTFFVKGSNLEEVDWVNQIGDAFTGNRRSLDYVISKQNNTVFYRSSFNQDILMSASIAYINNTTTDFIFMTTFLDNDYDDNAQLMYIDSSDSNNLSDIHLWRMLRFMSRPYEAYLISFIYTPFSTNYEVHIVENVKDEDAVKCMSKIFGKGKQCIIYDPINEAFYYLILSNMRNYLIKYICKITDDESYCEINPYIISIHEDSSIEVKGVSLSKSTWIMYLSVSLVNDIRRRFSKSVKSFKEW